MHFIILYDGVCGLCNRFVRLTLKLDQQDRFRFASLQSPLAANILHRHGINPLQLDTVYLVMDYESGTERLFAREQAVVIILQHMGGAWKICARLAGLLPQQFLRWLYNMIASRRYRIFGKYEVCPLPNEKDRAKFLDCK